jgi:prepilin-type N-terminal cleavage/methylation domain-containing protein
MKNNRGFTLIELSVVACIFLLMAAALMPFVHMANGRAQRVRCASNLMRLSLGLHRYALDHAEAFPPDLSSLYPDYVKDRRVFNCPSVKAVGTPEKPGYAYVAGLSESSAGREIVLSDIDGNHSGSGKTIVRLDGTIEWVGK